jgi:hypothetical protein
LCCPGELIVPRTPDLPCASCGRLMWRGSTSLPSGKAMCRPCRRANAEPTQTYERTCRTCGQWFETTLSRRVYCSPSCRPGKMTSTINRGYGGAHQRLREQWRLRMVEDGEYVECHAAVCFMPDRWVDPGQPWDLGHTRDRSGWTGPEHRYCNRKEPQLRTEVTPRTPRRHVL